MATVYPTATGVWSTRTWNDDSTGSAYGSGTPQVGDIVLANGTTVTVDVSIHVASLRTSAGTHAAAGGGFTSSANGLTSTVDNDITAGTTSCLTCSQAGANSHTITGSALTINGSTTTINSRGVTQSSTGTLTITGNAIGGGQSSAIAINISAASTLNMTGNVTGGTANTAYGISIGTTGIINLTGTATGGSVTGNTSGVNIAAGTGSISAAIGGSSSGGHGILLTTGSVTVGTVTGGSISGAFGVNNSSTGTVTVSTSVTGGSVAGAFGAVNASTGQLILNGSVNASTTCPAISDTVTSAGFIEIVNGPIVNSTGINAIVAAHICIGPSVQWTIAQPGTPPAYSGTVILKGGSSGIAKPLSLAGGMQG